MRSTSLVLSLVAALSMTSVLADDLSVVYSVPLVIGFINITGDDYIDCYLTPVSNSKVDLKCMPD